MTRAEKFAFASMVEYAKADVAIEIGTYKGGSLQVLSNHADKVYSLDISAECKKTLSGRFRNVEFLTGDSKILIPQLLKRLAENGDELGFVLIDGDHSTEGVREDTNEILKHVPTRPLYIVLHDSFNPEVRQGILSASWAECPFAHYVEVDFIPGVYHFEPFDTAQAKSMWGGLALAVLLPERRDGALHVHQSQRGLYEEVYKTSCYHPSASESTGRSDANRKPLLRRLKESLRIRSRLQ